MKLQRTGFLRKLSSCNFPRQKYFRRRGLFAVVFLCGTLAAAHADGAGAMLLVANKGDHTLSLIDPVAGKQIAVVADIDVR